MHETIICPTKRLASASYPQNAHLLVRVLCYTIYNMKKQKILEKALIEKRNDIIKNLYDDGYSYSDIAFIFKVAHTTILRILKKWMPKEFFIY